MKTIPPFIYLLFFSFILNAQTPAENLAKYRVYRDRLLGKDGGGGFISIGSEAGQSIPAAGRNPYRSCSSDWHLLHAGCQTNEKLGATLELVQPSPISYDDEYTYSPADNAWPRFTWLR